MADRTLRRTYNGASGNAPIDANADGGGIGIVNADAVSDGATDGDESTVVIDDSNDVGNSDSVSSVGSVEIDPAELTEFIARDSAGNAGGNSDNGEPRKRRGRKPGTGRKPGSKKAQETVAPFLLMAHQWGAVLLKTPEIALSTDEAKQLSDAYSAFCEYHDVPVLSPKRMSEINMIAALCLVYGPRVVAIGARRRQARREKNTGNVTPIAAVN